MNPGHWPAVLNAAHPLWPLLGTLAAYEAGLRVQRRCGGRPLANPVLVAVAIVVAGVVWSGESSEGYVAGVQPLRTLLGSATIALALPLHRSLRRIRDAFWPVLVSVGVGAVVAATTAVSVASLLGASDLILRSIATKSATAAIALAVSPQIGGDPSLAAGIAVLTGIVGAVICTWVFDRVGVRDPRARGLATGIAAHGIGTARMLGLDPEAGAFSGLAMSLTGVATGVALPLAYSWLG